MRRTLLTLVAVTALVAGVYAAPRSRAASGRAEPGRFAGPGVTGYGDAGQFGGFGGAPLAAPAVGMAATPDGGGYWVAAADGGVFSYGNAAFHGSLGALRIYAPIVGMAATPDGGGYWLVAMDGGVFSFGDARFLGSLGAHPPEHSVVGMAAAPGGLGYWLVGSDGSVYPFGTAANLGSAAGQPLAAPIVGMAATRDGLGYWLVASDGGVFTYGDAGFFGSAANTNFGTWVNAMAATPDDQGYWLLAATGGILTFGDAPSEGPAPNNPPFSPAESMAATPDGRGYWEMRQDEASTNLSDPSPASAAFPAGADVVADAAGQVGPDADASQGSYCNPYGPCEEWCSLFAAWVWNQVGLGAPEDAFTGDLYNWAVANGTALSPTDRPEPGDGVFYGTGPQNASTSVHMGIVAQVWPDGAIDTIEGDSGPEPDGMYAVVLNGPFLPAESQAYNATPIYGYARP